MRFEKSLGGLFTPTKELLRVGGVYTGQIIRAGKVIDEFECENLVVNEGLNSVLSIMLASGTQLTTWYLGLFKGNYTPVATDTAAVIAANATEATEYTGGVRPTWTPGAVASQSVDNSGARASFTFNAGITVYGAFLVSSSTISGTSGKLFSAARFSASKVVQSADQLLLTYTFSASSV